MAVKVVTDSTADLSPPLARELGVTVVPLYVRFGGEVYRDGVDISPDEFYRRLEDERVHPTTSQPAPEDFYEVYRRLSQETDEIISLHLASKLSGTYSSARQVRGQIKGVRIEVLDSESISMGLGLAVICAARMARAGASLARAVAEARQASRETRVFGIVDTLKFLQRGGRIGKAQALLGSMLHIRPLLTMREGEIVPIGVMRTRAQGVERLVEAVEQTSGLQELAVVYSTDPEEGSSLRERLGTLVSPERSHLARLGPGLGVHGGPGTLLVAFRAGGLVPVTVPETAAKRLTRPVPVPRTTFSRLRR